MSERSSYAAREQARLDAHKERLQADDGFDTSFDVGASHTSVEDQYKKEGIDAQPSKLREVGRKLLDTPVLSKVFDRLHQSSNDRRDKEAMFTALQEFVTDRQAKKKADEAQRIVDQEAEDERRLADLRAKMNFQTEQENAQAALEARQKQQWEENKQIWHQETEQKFNETLTSMDELRQAVEQGLEGISREVETVDGERAVEELKVIAKGLIEHALDEISQEIKATDGKSVEVFRLDGYNLQALQHDISYGTAWARGEARAGPDDRARSANTLFAHPKFWNEGKSILLAPSDMHNPEIYVGREDLARKSSYISTTYFDTSKYIPFKYDNRAQASREMLAYGFEKIDDRELLAAEPGDLGTRGLERHIRASSPEEMVEGSVRQGDNYNEAAITRKNPETGENKKPDYIIVSSAADEGMMAIAKVHAAYHDVPVVVVNARAENYVNAQANYKQELRAKGVQLKGDAETSVPMAA